MPSIRKSNPTQSAAFIAPGTQALLEAPAVEAPAVESLTIVSPPDTREAMEAAMKAHIANPTPETEAAMQAAMEAHKAARETAIANAAAMDGEALAKETGEALANNAVSQREARRTLALHLNAKFGDDWWNVKVEQHLKNIPAGDNIQLALHPIRAAFFAGLTGPGTKGDTLANKSMNWKRLREDAEDYQAGRRDPINGRPTQFDDKGNAITSAKVHAQERAAKAKADKAVANAAAAKIPADVRALETMRRMVIAARETCDALPDGPDSDARRTAHKLALALYEALTACGLPAGTKEGPADA